MVFALIVCSEPNMDPKHKKGGNHTRIRSIFSSCLRRPRGFRLLLLVSYLLFIKYDTDKTSARDECCLLITGKQREGDALARGATATLGSVQFGLLLLDQTRGAGVRNQNEIRKAQEEE